ncbi:MAG: small acid-soluble spore protein Tlp [Bacillota bacterium]|jgi:small acid-soluble spore protein (thioredoxin-like protein)|nr:small acid-soluble spore protein Tlp [Bacillota bacterium]HHT90310.1 small acid-soluble spore protein Tlp [Bacillota bacterium]
MPRGPKPDDRRDNVDKLREQVVNTIENLEASHDTLRMDLPEEQKEVIRAKNRRRKQSIAGKREEIRDEYAFQQKQDE